MPQERSVHKSEKPRPSRTLSAQERKASSVSELECLAILFGTDKFRKYIEHQEFVLETDNQALLWLLSHPRQLGKIGRWVVKISALKFEVRHIRGTQNIVADALSLMFEPSKEEEPSPVSCNLTLTDFPLALEELQQLKLRGPELADICSRLQKGEKIANYVLSKGTLYWCTRKRRELRLVLSPLGGHLGVNKTISKIRTHFAWKRMDTEIRSKVRAYHTCSLSKPAQNTRLGLMSSEVAKRPMQKLFIDYVRKFPRSKAGNTVILVFVDAFSKFVWLIPLREATSKATV
jgi:hypothetical protein